MAKTYVIGIGGTGSRIIRSLMALLTSGANTSGHSIVPVLIDLDGSNEDTSIAFQFVDQYIEMYKKIYSENTSSASDTFLRTKVEALQDGQDTSSGNKIEFIKSNQTFAEYIGYSRTKDDTNSYTFDLEVENNDKLDKDFLDSIFDTSAPPKENATNNNSKGDLELYLNMSKGFKGHPNIGCIAFNEIKNNDLFKQLLNSAANEGNKIFIISSIFGGTGASGFPQILKLIDIASDSNDTGGLNLDNRINLVPVGALSVFPYFKLKEPKPGKDNSIASNTFMTKSKAALYYYENQMSRLSVMYNLFDDALVQYENNSGGKEQANPAHWIELVGAYSILHFIQSDIKPVPDKQKSYGFFAAYDRSDEKLKTELDFTNFFKDTKSDVLLPLLKSGVAWFLCYKIIDKNKNETFSVELNLDNSKSKENEFLNDFKEFLDIFFKKWITEIQENERALKLFNFSANSLTEFLPHNFINEEDKERYASLTQIHTKKLNEISKMVSKDYGSRTVATKTMKFIELSVDEIINLYHLKLN